MERGADQRAIKKAYHKLATVWHPDKHANKETQEEATAKFKEISEAYAVLSDTEKRIQYDSHGDTFVGRPRYAQDPFDIFRNFGFQAGPSRGPRPLRGQSIQQVVGISLKDALFGVEKSFEFQVNSSCEKCDGRKATEFETCDKCKGKGIHVNSSNPNMVMHTLCPACRGEGKKILKPCDMCNGQGLRLDSKSLTVTIPVGISHGTVLRLAQQGGRGFFGGPPGDILLKVDIEYPVLTGWGEEDKEKLRSLLSK